jgi:hypothetical protein
MDMNNEASAPHDIVLDIHICDQRRSYRTVFAGPDANAMALAFCRSRSATHAFHEVEAEPLDPTTDLYAFLYPVCEHGMPQSSCYGPQHYYFDEEEQARGHFNSF